MRRRGGGRPALLPPTGHRPAPRLNTETAKVRFVGEDASHGAAEFDFATVAGSPALRAAFADTFAARVGPGGSLRSLGSAKNTFLVLRSFADYLAGLTRPPAAVAELREAHVRGWALRRNDRANRALARLKAGLRGMPGLNPEFAVFLAERHPPRGRSELASYSREEFNRIVAAARADVRRTAVRIRANRQVLQHWRAGVYDDGPPDMPQRGRLLDHVDRHVALPQGDPDLLTTQAGEKGPRVRAAQVTALHLSSRDAAAFVVLLVALTGQNPSTIVNAPAAHHRPDGHSGGPATAVVELDKPRRGRRRHMDVALVGLPRWLPTPAANDLDDAGGDDRVDLRSPFGVYMLLHELAAPARAFLGSDRLLVWWAQGVGATTGLVSYHVRTWAKAHHLLDETETTPAADGEAPAPRSRVTLQRLRLTFLELHQRPVAHAEHTLANEYLARNRGNIEEYRKVIADVLAREVAKATTRERIRSLSPADLAEARQHPASVAARHGMDAQTLTRLLAGELDTIVAGCVDNVHSPHAPAGQPCRASFMLCLGCPCARATPQHLPLQTVLHDELLARRAGMTPLRWAQRYALPHAQLADLLQRAGSVAVADARATVTADDRQLITRFLNRELDLP